MNLIKSQKEIDLMRASGQRLAQVMNELEKKVVAGVSTEEIDEEAEKLIYSLGGIPAFKGYGGPNNPFPNTICASINDEVVHGIPSAQKILKQGDILKIDIGMIYNDHYSDMARTFPVGKINSAAEKIIKTVRESFYQGLSKIKSGAWLSDYSKAVQNYVERQGFSVVRNLTGHGIGRHLHEEPSIYNFYDKNNYQDLRLKEGMTLALEPMINAGRYETILGNDGWAFLTIDGKLSAHWENTILVTRKGSEILTEFKK